MPGRNGGIENYTHWLAKLLLKKNFEVEIATLYARETGDYIYEGIKVNDLKNAFDNFELLLKNGHFDICHFHEYSEYGGIEIPWFKKAKDYCKKVFFTFHLPYLTCYKLDFRYKGIDDCNTFSNPKRCTECVIADKIHFKKHHSDVLLNFTEGIMKISGLKKKLKAGIISKHENLNQLVSICDQLFIYADWFKNIMAENEYNQSSIKKIPYKSKTQIPASGIVEKQIKNRMLFVGRIQHQKGLHLLSKAMNLLTTRGIQLDVYGNMVDQHYYDQCLQNFRFNFKGTTTHLQLLKILKQYDFLVLPSVFTEMYSMIIKDAFYEQLPVIASMAKGNRDAIQDGVNGFLFEYDNARDLAATMDKAYDLKKKGWQPVFTYPENPERDIEEIISYYC